MSHCLVFALTFKRCLLASAVQCTENTIVVNFVTKNPFQGRIFVKGMADKPDCTQSYFRTMTPTTTPSIAFGFGMCNMIRARTVDPQPGMIQSLMVIISFHKLFITKIDKVYKIQCFYMETQQTVTLVQSFAGLLMDTNRMPTCTYEVRRGGPDGPIIRFAQVGEPVYHEWSCDSNTHNILVKDCCVDDGQGNQYKIIDENGCAVDPVILGDITYTVTGPAKAYVNGFVFKYADKPSVFYQCTVQLCNKGDEYCESLTVVCCQNLSRQSRSCILYLLQPPSCGLMATTPSTFSWPIRRTQLTKKRQQRSRRLARMNDTTGSAAGKYSQEIDLFTQTMTVLDLDDFESSNDMESLRRMSQNYPRTIDEESGDNGKSFCFSAFSFSAFMTFVAIVFTTTVVAFCMICKRKQSQEKAKPHK
ncbi:unnamed protein product [Soboliphyme baturini]|uniref:ZP domain-containing protein n=1 Tax=Soboliphyme baturini TaxID=241478 RepID=A0A183IGK9_9BILA|nr:unnamed protein product [Soboliphyme baturini]